MSGLRNRYENSKQGKVPATGPLVIDFGNAPSGREWDLRRVAIMDSDNPVTLRDATVFIMTPKGTSASFLPSEVADVTPCGIPTANNYSRGTIVFGPLESVQLWIYGLPVDVNITATMQVEEAHA